MNRSPGLAATLLCLMFVSYAHGQAVDPYLWLEEVESEDVLAWVDAKNTASLAVLTATKVFDPIYQKNISIYDSDDRIAEPSIHGNFVYNFWQDKENVRGIWRRTGLDDYLTGDPRWETLIDLDEMSSADSVNWVYKGSSCLYPDYDRCMISLSNGGADATVKREFDIATREFVDSGFHVPEAKGSVTWIDENTVYVATDFGDGTVTESGYPRIVKRWSRNAPLDAAEIVFEGEYDDVGSWPFVINRPEGQYEGITRAVTFYTSEKYMLRGERLVKMDIPYDAAFSGVFGGRLLVSLKSDWTPANMTYKQGSLVSINVDAFFEGDRSFDVVVEPDDRSSIVSVSATANLLLVNMLENVKSKLYAFSLVDDVWVKEEVEAPGVGTVGVASTSATDDKYFFEFEGFLTPSSLFFVDGREDPKRIRSLPDFFDSEGLLVTQHEAISTDGTRIPYFVVGRDDLALDGNNPTLLYAYGGFEVSVRPGYSATVGSAWLERGGTYAVANIRGGGEFGPSWHQAGLKENRQRVYDDFAAVAEDLIGRGVTSPRRLGISGGSNGGLLVGVAFTQRPDLFNAVVCSVPLLDMQRYDKLLAGASWVGEYGDPDIPEEWEFIGKYSPYHNVRQDETYPVVFFNTSTRDDRVHPGHARKMVARMESMGHDVLYWENTEGGHAAATTNEQRAFRSALVYSYLHQRLSDDAPVGSN